MAELLEDCPRCGAKHTTFDVGGDVVIAEDYHEGTSFETFAICRHCGKSTVFVLRTKDRGFADVVKQKRISSINGSVQGYFKVDGYISLKDAAARPPPDHVPTAIAQAFNEGSRCFAVKCFNAAGTMFRLCVDLATRQLLPEPNNNSVAQPNAKQRRDLGLRLPWLFDQGLLPAGLHDLSFCIKEDGNDGAHAGTLERQDAEDVLDFTVALLERLYTEPARIEKAKERQAARRSGNGK